MNDKIKSISAGNLKIGPGNPVFIVAELSGNHLQDFGKAVELIHAAKECGVDAVKIQTYTPDTLTIDCDNEYFMVKGNAWEGENLYSLYGKVYTPWEWQEKLMGEAEKAGIMLFSTAYEKKSTDFIVKLGMPVIKIASFEIVDIPFLDYAARQNLPLIISTGMSNFEEIKEAVETVKNAGNNDLILLKCVSDYPANPCDMNLKTIPDMVEKFDVLCGFSDHSLDLEPAITAVALGACMIEKHMKLSEKDEGPDSFFSMTPEKFGEMVKSIRKTEKALGKISYNPVESEKKSMVFRRSIFIIEDVEEGDEVTKENVRSIRPGYGIHPRHLKEIMGRSFCQSLKKGTPLKWEFIK